MAQTLTASALPTDHPLVSIRATNSELILLHADALTPDTDPDDPTQVEVSGANSWVIPVAGANALHLFLLMDGNGVSNLSTACVARAFGRLRAPNAGSPMNAPTLPFSFPGTGWLPVLPFGADPTAANARQIVFPTEIFTDADAHTIDHRTMPGPILNVAPFDQFLLSIETAPASPNAACVAGILIR